MYKDKLDAQRCHVHMYIDCNFIQDVTSYCYWISLFFNMSKYNKRWRKSFCGSIIWHRYKYKIIMCWHKTARNFATANICYCIGFLLYQVRIMLYMYMYMYIAKLVSIVFDIVDNILQLAYVYQWAMNAYRTSVLHIVTYLQAIKHLEESGLVAVCGVKLNVRVRWRYKMWL